MSVFIILEFIDIVGVIVVAVTVAVEISMYYRLRVSIVLLGILLRHLHPSSSYRSVVLSDQVVVGRATHAHKRLLGESTFDLGTFLGVSGDKGVL